MAILGCGKDNGGSGATESETGDTAMPTTTMTSSDPDTVSPDDGATIEPMTGDTTAAPMTDTGAESSTGDPPIVCPYAEVAGTPDIELELVASGCDRPLMAIGHPTQPDRLFVVEQGGDVRIVEPGSGQCGEAFLTVNAQNANSTFIGPESGLLGFAFHPNFPDDPRVYVNYNPAGGQQRTTVQEFSLDPNDPNKVDPASGRIVIEICQPASNHNGGMLLFDQAGMLLITMGDGGPQNDGLGNGRDPGVLLGKILRIDVEPDGQSHNPDSTNGQCPDLGPFTSYGIPKDNPFVGDANFAPEIYAWGFRNPWRAAIDPATQLLYVGDVGQGQREEIDVVRKGADLGWSRMEGVNCFAGAGCPAADPGTVNSEDITLPITDYAHSGNRCSVTGGSVYRSCQVPAWQGLYFYGDYCTGELGAIVWDEATQTVVQDFGLFKNIGERILGNGWNAYGDVFITSVISNAGVLGDGHVYRIAP